MVVALLLDSLEKCEMFGSLQRIRYNTATVRRRKPILGFLRR